MPVTTILRHTPEWVWILLAFLIYRGLKSVVPRTMSPRRLLLLPVIFLVWALHGITYELDAFVPALAGFIVALAVGLAAGHALARCQQAPHYDSASGMISRPGSIIPLALIVATFITKYSLSVYLAYHPNLRTDAGFCSLFGAVSGLTDGMFWGLMLTQVARAIRSAGIKPCASYMMQLLLTDTPLPLGENREHNRQRS